MRVNLLLGQHGYTTMWICVNLCECVCVCEGERIHMAVLCHRPRSPSFDSPLPPLSRHSVCVGGGEIVIEDTD